MCTCVSLIPLYFFFQFHTAMGAFFYSLSSARLAQILQCITGIIYMPMDYFRAEPSQALKKAPTQIWVLGNIRIWKIFIRPV